jgi:hypothetical protein
MEYFKSIRLINNKDIEKRLRNYYYNRPKRLYTFKFCY